MNIGALLPRHARYRSGHTALVVGDVRLDYQSLNHRVNQLANALVGLGLKKGDKVATILPNCIELMLAYWAVAKTGLVIVPASPLLTANGLRTLLDDSDTVCILADASFEGVIQELLPELTGVSPSRVIIVDSARDRASGNFTRYEELTASAATGEPPAVEIFGDDPFNIMYSSGTTGAPKGIIHTHYIRAMYCTLFASTWRMRPET